MKAHSLSTALLCSVLSLLQPSGAADAARDEGRASLRPWSGPWWPHKSGGLTKPLAKYDRVTGLQATKWERQNHVATNPPPQDWFGHCHAWSAAAVSEQEPRQGKHVQQVDFSVGDLKGLLTACHAQDVANSYGSRYDEGDGPAERADLGPDELWRLLQTYVGQRKIPLILDLEPDAEVWNYPIYEYQVDYEIGSDGWCVGKMQLVAANNNVGMDYVGTEPALHEYTFRVKFADGAIVMGSGQWTGDSVDDHPDFAWYPYVAVAENPDVDVEQVAMIVGNPVGGGNAPESAEAADTTQPPSIENVPAAPEPAPTPPAPTPSTTPPSPTPSTPPPTPPPPTPPPPTPIPPPTVPVTPTVPVPPAAPAPPPPPPAAPTPAQPTTPEADDLPAPVAEDPSVEIQPAPPENLQDLLSADELSALVVNKTSHFFLDIQVDRGDGGIYRPGDPVQVSVVMRDSGRKGYTTGYLYLFDIGPKGELQLVYPQPGASNRIEADKVYRIPLTKNDLPFVPEGLGQHDLKAVVTLRPVKLSGFAVQTAAATQQASTPAQVAPETAPAAQAPAPAAKPGASTPAVRRVTQPLVVHPRTRGRLLRRFSLFRKGTPIDLAAPDKVGPFAQDLCAYRVLQTEVPK